MKFNQEAFNDFAVEYALGFYQEPRILASGRISHWYTNWRDVMNDVFLANQLSDFLIAFVQDQKLNPDCFFGIPEGATKLANLTQNKLAQISPNYSPGSHCLPMGRAKPKNHGAQKDRYFIGEPIGKTIVLDDVITTGKSIITGCRMVLELRNSQCKLNSKNPAKIIKAIGLTDRLEVTDRIEAPLNIPRGISVKDALRSLDIEYDSMSNAAELLLRGIKKYNPSIEIREAIEEEFQNYGVVKKIGIA